MSLSHDVHISHVISALSLVLVCKASLQIDINLYKGTLVHAMEIIDSSQTSQKKFQPILGLNFESILFGLELVSSW